MKKIISLAAAIAAVFSLNSCGKLNDLIGGVIKNYNMGEELIVIESAQYELTTLQGLDKEYAKFSFVGKGSTSAKPIEMSITFPSALLSSDIPAKEVIYSATNGSGSVDSTFGIIKFGGNLAARFSSYNVTDTKIEGTINVKHIDSKWTIESSGFEIVFSDGITYNLDFGYIGKVEEN